MGWLEIIEIRVVGKNQKLLEKHLQELVNDVNQNANIKTVKVYRHAVLETDFSIHLFHDSQKSDTNCSSICEQLVSSLKDFGMVDHTVWIEKNHD